MFLKKTNLYLLPVPSASETTGNSEVDDLVIFTSIS
jgi:hypothetical protein